MGSKEPMAENSSNTGRSITGKPVRKYDVLALWRGDMPLGTAFWLWGALGGAGQLVAFSVLLLMLNGAPEGTAGWALLGWVAFMYVYFGFVFISIWRAAARTTERSYAWGARVMVIVGWILAAAITVQVLLMGGSSH